MYMSRDLCCFVLCVTVLCNIGKCVSKVKQKGGCFPLYVYRNCTSSQCPIDRDQYHNVYQYHRTPQNITLDLMCAKNEKIVIKQVRYLLPKSNNSYCKFVELNKNPAKCTRSSKCTCCAHKEDIKDQCIHVITTSKKQPHWINQCQLMNRGTGKCSLSVPRKKIHCDDIEYSCEVPSGGQGSRCFARWVEIMYSCEALTDKKVKLMREMTSHTKTSGIITTLTTGKTNSVNVKKSTAHIFTKKTILGLAIAAATIFVSLIIIATVIAVICIRQRKSSYVKRKPQSKNSLNASYYSNKGNNTSMCHSSHDDRSVNHQVYDDTTVSETEENAYNEIGEMVKENSGEGIKNKKKNKKNKDLRNHCTKMDKKKQPDVIELTENAYYETIELTNENCGNKDVNKDVACSYSKPNKKQKLQKLFQVSSNNDSKKHVYDYAYQHFELEGRKRSPKDT